MGEEGSRSLFSVIVIFASVSASVSGSGLFGVVGAQASGGGQGLILDSTALSMCCFLLWGLSGVLAC